MSLRSQALARPALKWPFNWHLLAANLLLRLWARGLHSFFTLRLSLESRFDCPANRHHLTSTTPSSSVHSSALWPYAQPMTTAGGSLTITGSLPSPSDAHPCLLNAASAYLKSSLTGLSLRHLQSSPFWF